MEARGFAARRVRWGGGFGGWRFALLGVLVLGMVGGAPAVAFGSTASAGTAVEASTAASAFGTLGDELVERRTRTSRTFVRDRNGASERVVRTYSGSVNYLSESGAWKAIDNALVASGAGYRNRAGWFDVGLPSGLGAGHVTVREDGDRVGFALRGANADGVVEGSKITYADAFAGVDVSYDVAADWLKELIVLRSRSSRRSFVFDVTLDTGLRPELVKSGAVEIRDRAGAVRMAIAAPFMTDAAGRDSRAVRFALAKTVDGWQLTLTADEEWLDAPGRAWPVRIDPQVFPRPVATAGWVQRVAGRY